MSAQSLSPPAPVNVSQVAQRSPLRYPGGKTWLVPEVQRWLAALPARPQLFIEPFAGGASVGLSVAFGGLAPRTLLVELDPAVAALWRVLVHGEDAEAEALCARIAGFAMSPEGIDAALDGVGGGAVERAFATVLRNRVNRGGILAAGASRMRRGENGRGLASRWYPQTLVRRIRAIRALRERLAFVEGDAFDALARHAPRRTAAWFIDPPYAHAGRRLYACHAIDHERLFAAAARCAGPVLMSYDDAPEVRALAARHGFAWRAQPMRTTHHATKCELLLTRPA